MKAYLPKFNRKHFALIAGVYFLCLAGAAAYHFVFGTKIALAVIGPPPLSTNMAGLGGIQNVLANSGLPLSGAANLNPDFDQLVFFLNSTAMADAFGKSYPEMVAHFLPAKNGVLPTAGEVARYLSTHLLINRLANTAFVRVEFHDADDRFAQQFLDRYLHLADTIVRHKKFLTYNRQSQFLQSKLQGVSNTDIKQSLSTLLTDVQRNLMTIDSSNEYAYQMIDPPYSDPKGGKAPGLLISLAMGFIAASLLTTIGVAMKSRIG